MTLNCGFSKIILLSSLFLFSCKDSFNGLDTSQGQSQERNAVTAISNFDFLPKFSSNQVVIHEYYTLSYDEKYEQAEWVAYTLTRENLNGSNFDRPLFIQDKKVKSESADWRNYKKSGYDKGHLCPAGDMKFSKKAFDKTFLTSNISPQKHDFNDGVWNRLEQKVRYWAIKYEKIYVITAGVLNENLETIGKEEVAVPDYFYKIIATNYKGNWKMIAFLMPHKESKMGLYNFVTSVDLIEKMTNIDFFPKLEDKIENDLEKRSDYKDWSF